MRTLYIAGRMHCGSTFLNVLLGAGEDAFPIGELISAMRRGKEELCSCGKPLHSCEIWGGAAQDYGDRTGRDFFEDGMWMYEQSSITKFQEVYRTRARQEPWKTYLVRQREVLRSIAAATGRGIGIDSSKEYTRALLVLFSDPDAKVLHLVRDPVSIVGSYYWRQTTGSRFYFLKRSFEIGRLRFPAMMLVALSWNVGVIAGKLLKRAFPERVLDVSYERFCNEPTEVLREIGAFADLDLSQVVAGVEEKRGFPLGHSLGGNAEIKTDSGTFTFVPNAGGRRRMPTAYRIGSWVFSIPGRTLRAIGN